MSSDLYIDSCRLIYKSASRIYIEPFERAVGRVIIGNSTSSERLIQYVDAKVDTFDVIQGSSMMAALDRAENRLFIYNIKRGALVCELKYLKPVKQISITQQYLFVAFEGEVRCYNLSSMKLEQTLIVSERITALCAQQAQGNTFVCIGFAAGSVTMYGLNSETALALWSQKIHSNPVTLLKICERGDHLASASSRGTLIRVLSCQDGSQLRLLRRGLSPVPLLSMSYDEDCMFLCTAGKSSTVHIFTLCQENEKTTFVMEGGARDLACIHLSDQYATASKAVFIRHAAIKEACTVIVIQDAPETGQAVLEQFQISLESKQCVLMKSTHFEK